MFYIGIFVIEILCIKGKFSLVYILFLEFLYLKFWIIVFISMNLLGCFINVCIGFGYMVLNVWKLLNVKYLFFIVFLICRLLWVV